MPVAVADALLKQSKLNLLSECYNMANCQFENACQLPLSNGWIWCSSLEKFQE